MRLGVFTPIGNNGWIPSATSPQYLPTHTLTKSVLSRAEDYGFDFALCMVKLKGFGGTTKFLGLHPRDLHRDGSGRRGHLEDPSVLLRRHSQLAPGHGREDGRHDRRRRTRTVRHQHRDGLESRRVHADGTLARGRLLPRPIRLRQRVRHHSRRLGPQPAHKIELVAAGSSQRGRRFAAEFTDFNFTDASDGVAGLVSANEALATETAKTGRDVKSLVLRMVILDDTDEAARKKVEYYNQGSDRAAIAYMSGNYALDKANEDASSQRFAEEYAKLQAIPDSGGLLAGSPATVAAALNELATVEGTGGILMSFDDYGSGLDRFGQEVIPLLDFEPTLTHAAEAPS